MSVKLLILTVLILTVSIAEAKNGKNLQQQYTAPEETEEVKEPLLEMEEQFLQVPQGIQQLFQQPTYVIKNCGALSVEWKNPQGFHMCGTHACQQTSQTSVLVCGRCGGYCSGSKTYQLIGPQVFGKVKVCNACVGAYEPL